MVFVLNKRNILVLSSKLIINTLYGPFSLKLMTSKFAEPKESGSLAWISPMTPSILTCKNNVLKVMWKMLTAGLF